MPSTIAIDGPAAAGKSTIAERLAKKLGYLYCDTGVMYRAVTWVALKRGVPIADEAAVTKLAMELRIDVIPPTVSDGRQYTVLADGNDVTWDIRRPEVDANVSPVSAYPGVRAALTEQQRRIGQRGRVVMVGRDIGTVVLPEAALKIYLTASPEERARRRYREILARGESADYSAILEAMLRRDQIDSEREAAPLRPADDAVIVDTEGLSIDEVLARVEQLANRTSHITHRTSQSAIRNSLRSLIRHLSRWLLRLLFRLLTRWELRGAENVPPTGPLIVAFNHLAHLDGPLLIASLPRIVEGLALVDLYRVPVTGQLLWLYGTIPVHREEFDRAVVERALRVLERGEVLIIAPEARMSVTGGLERGRTGVAYLALRSGAPILPVAITGTETIPQQWRRLRRPRITVTIGQPFRLSPPPPSPASGRGWGSKAQRRAAADELMRHIVALLPPQYRGVYANETVL
jgi:cytidylate kinase